MSTGAKLKKNRRTMSKRVRRTLRLDALENDQGEKSPSRKPLEYSQYSPMTGTCKIGTPGASNKHDVKGGPEGAGQVASISIPTVPGSSSRGQHPTNENADVLELLSQVEKSVETFLKMRRSLKNLQALEHNRGFRHLAGFEDPSSNLRAELQKTKALISQARRKRQKTC